jgi:hypothetical protein
MKNLFFKAALLSSVLAIATASNARASGEAIAGADDDTDPHHHGLLSSVNLGIRYSSVLENRGVIFYRDFQIDPVLGLFFLDDRVEFLGDSIGFRDFVVKDWLRLRTRFVSITDKPLFPSIDSIRNGSPQRPDTYEWSNSAEIFIPGYNSRYLAEIDITYAKDISANHGNYLELQSKIKLTDFRIPKVGTKVEPNFFSSIGWGDGALNQYYYGPSADSAGLNNVAYGLWFAFPEEADRYYPIIQIRHFEAIGQSGRGEYAVGRNEGWLLSFIATYGVLE